MKKVIVKFYKNSSLLKIFLFIYTMSVNVSVFTMNNLDLKEQIFRYCNYRDSTLLKSLINQCDNVNEMVDEGDNIAIHLLKKLCQPYTYHDYEIFISILEILLNKGLDLNAQDINGDNLLHLIFQRKDSDLLETFIKFLIFNGIDLSKNNKKSQTPISIAPVSFIPFLNEYTNFIKKNSLYQNDNINYAQAGPLFKQKLDKERIERIRQKKIYDEAYDKGYQAGYYDARKKRCIIM